VRGVAAHQLRYQHLLLLLLLQVLHQQSVLARVATCCWASATICCWSLPTLRCCCHHAAHPSCIAACLVQSGNPAAAAAAGSCSPQPALPLLLQLLLCSSEAPRLAETPASLPTAGPVHVCADVVDRQANPAVAAAALLRLRALLAPQSSILLLAAESF
jgi:hypothetical protein